MRSAQLIARLFAAAIGLRAFMALGSAHACSCSEPASESYPKDGETVPLNVKLWLSKRHAAEIVAFDVREVDLQHSLHLRSATRQSPMPTPEELGRAVRLTGSSGNDVPFEVRTLRVTMDQHVTHYILTPTVPLTPGSLELRTTRPTREGVTHLMTLTVGNVVDDVAPHRIVVRPGSYQSSGDGWCGHGEHAVVPVTHRGILTLVAFTREPRPLPSHPLWVSDVFESGEVRIGQSSCSNNWSFDDMPLFVSFGAYDVAGNFSGWTEARRIEDLAEIDRNSTRWSTHGCTCEVRPRQHRESNATPLMLVGLLFWRKVMRRCSDAS